MEPDPKELAAFLKIIGNNLRTLRMSSNKDILTIAVETGIPEDDIFNIEVGESAHLDPKYLLILSDYFQVNLSRFFKGWSH